MDTQYSIRELEHLTGIKAHTLRAWEQRYQIITPQRTDTNIRYYNGNDLKYLLNIALLNRNGYKISKIAQLAKTDINELVETMTEDVSHKDSQISALTRAMIEIDETYFEELMEANIAAKGFEQTMLQIIYPFLERIGVLWMSGSINPAQEHFMTNLIRQKLLVFIDKVRPKHVHPTPHYILFLPEGELHELGLLFAHYLLKVRNIKVTYLGTSVPVKDVIEVVNIKNANIVFSLLTSRPTKRNIEKFVDSLASQLPKCQIILSGYLASRIAFPLPTNVKVIHEVMDLEDLKLKSV